jgi:hypothetical protein
MPDIEAMMVLVPALILAVFVAYYAMWFTAHRRYQREEATERERKRQEKAAK